MAAPSPLLQPTDWLTTSVSSETLQHVLSFLATPDRFALLACNKVLAAEPVATHYASFCGACSACSSKTPHLCAAKDNAQPAACWTQLLQHSPRGALQSLRLATCRTFTAGVLLRCPTTTTHALAKLHVLDLNRCDALGAAGLQVFAATCTQLQELRLRDMAIDSIAFAQLVTANANTLRNVDLLGCHTLTSDDVRTLAKCPNLVDLSLWGCHNVANAAIAFVVERCAALRRLNLRYCHKVDDRLIATIATALPQLRDLNVRYCYKLTDAAVATICDALPQLETLNLSQCARITDAAIIRIVVALQALKELRLWGCTKLTSASVIAISSSSLRLVDIRSRDKFEAVIGGPTALKFLIQTYRNTLTEWQQAGDDVGVFKRQRLCAVAA